MKAVIFLLVLAFALFFVGGLLFYGLAFPIWMFIDCVTSQTMSKKAKILWGIGIFIAWPLTSFFYGLLASGRRVVQWLSGVGLFGTAAVLVMVFPLVGFLSKMTTAELTKIQGRLPQIEVSEISEAEKAKLQGALHDLQKEGETGGFFHLNQRRIDWELADLFTLLVGDDKLSRSEYDDWMNKYESRRVLDLDALKNHVRDLKQTNTRL